MINCFWNAKLYEMVSVTVSMVHRFFEWAWWSIFGTNSAAFIGTTGADVDESRRDFRTGCNDWVIEFIRDCRFFGRLLRWPTARCSRWSTSVDRRRWSQRSRPSQARAAKRFASPRRSLEATRFVFSWFYKKLASGWVPLYGFLEQTRARARARVCMCVCVCVCVWWSYRWPAGRGAAPTIFNASTGRTDLKGNGGVTTRTGRRKRRRRHAVWRRQRHVQVSGFDSGSTRAAVPRIKWRRDAQHGARRFVFFFHVALLGSVPCRPVAPSDAATHRRIVDDAIHQTWLVEIDVIDASFSSSSSASSSAAAATRFMYLISPHLKADRSRLIAALVIGRLSQ